MPPRPLLEWKPHVVRGTITRAVLEESPSPLHEAILQYVERPSRQQLP